MPSHTRALSYRLIAGLLKFLAQLRQHSRRLHVLFSKRVFLSPVAVAGSSTGTPLLSAQHRLTAQRKDPKRDAHTPFLSAHGCELRGGTRGRQHHWYCVEEAHSKKRLVQKTTHANGSESGYHTIPLVRLPGGSALTAQISFGAGPAARIVIDTGSASAWVKRQLYKAHKDSQTEEGATPVAKPFRVRYCSGDVYGSVARAKVALSQQPSPWSMLNTGLAERESGLLRGRADSFDGVLGFAFPAVGNPGLSAPLKAIRGVRRFAISLDPRSSYSGEGGDTGRFHVGDVRPHMLASAEDMWFAPVVRPLQYWSVRFSGQSDTTSSEGPGLQTALTSTPLCSSPRGCKGFIDSGTSFIGLAEREYTRVMDAITAGRPCIVRRKRVRCSCEGAHQPFPTLTLATREEQGIQRTLHVPPTAYMTVSTSWWNLNAALCEPALGVIEPSVLYGRAQLVLGLPFLRAYNTLFDDADSNGAHPQIGLARIAEPKTPKVPGPQRDKPTLAALVVVLAIACYLMPLRARHTAGASSPSKAPPARSELDLTTKNEKPP